MSALSRNELADLYMIAMKGTDNDKERSRLMVEAYLRGMDEDDLRRTALAAIDGPSGDDGRDFTPHYEP